MSRIGFSFRESLGFVTDTTDTVAWLGEAYPTAKSTVGTGLSVTAGFDADLSVSANYNVRDKDSGINPKLAGIVFAYTGTNPVGDAVFTVDLPSSGTWEIRLAAGNATGTGATQWSILNSDASTVLASQSLVTTASGEFYDASGVLRTTPSDWVTNNASISVTFSGTKAYFVLTETAAASMLAYLEFYQSASGATVSTITGTTVTEAGNEVFTVTMSGTGGGTFAYSWTGGATSADYTTTLTTGMCAVTGGSGSVTVSGSNITVDSTVTAFTVTVPTTTDTLDEANETIRLVIGGVTLFGPVGGAMPNTLAVVKNNIIYGPTYSVSTMTAAGVVGSGGTGSLSTGGNTTVGQRNTNPFTTTPPTTAAHFTPPIGSYARANGVSVSEWSDYLGNRFNPASRDSGAIQH